MGSPAFHPASAPDYVPPSLLADLQLERLQRIIARAFERVPLFRSRMEARGLTPADIRSLADLAEVPFTTKADLRDTYPFGLFASPMQEIVRLHASSGTTGKPIVVAYTQEDLDVWTIGHGAQLRGLRPASRATSSRTPTATACSPADWARITAPKAWARRSSPSRAATPTGRSWS